MNFSVILKCIIYFSSNFKETELIQYLKPVGLGPSGKHVLNVNHKNYTSLLFLSYHNYYLGSLLLHFYFLNHRRMATCARVKLFFLMKIILNYNAHINNSLFLQKLYSPEKGGSVPPSLVTRCIKSSLDFIRISLAFFL